jgi:hypothetical protein
MAEAQRQGPGTRVDKTALDLALGRLVGHPTDEILKTLILRQASTQSQSDPEAPLRVLESLNPFLAKEVRALTAVLSAAQASGEDSGE